MKGDARKAGEDRSEERPAGEGEKNEKALKKEGKGLDYVFKVVPADPKNAFNFEDVADK